MVSGNAEGIFAMIIMIFLGILSLIGVGCGIGAIISMSKEGIGDWMGYTLCAILILYSFAVLLMVIVGFVLG